MKKVLAVVTISFMLIGSILSGCGSAGVEKAALSGDTTALAASSAAVSSDTTAASSEKPTENYAKEISFFQWTEYTPQTVLDAFKEKYGITVKMTMYSSNEEMLAKLQAGGMSQYDFIVPSNYFLKPLLEQDMIEPIDKDSIPNLKNIDPSCLNKDFDPGNKYSVPYMLSPCLLVVNTKKVTKPITSYNDLLDPSLKKSLVVVDDEREIIGIALKELGYSINDTDEKHLKEAGEWMKKLKPNIKVFDSDSPKTSLISGDCTVGFVYGGEAAAAMRENPDIKLVWAKEGIGNILDGLALIKGTKHKKEAELFMNFILEPNISKMVTDAYPYTNPNNAAHDLLAKTYLDNPASNVPFSKVGEGEFVNDIGDALTIYDKIWTEFKG